MEFTLSLLSETGEVGVTLDSQKLKNLSVKLRFF